MKVAIIGGNMFSRAGGFDTFVTEIAGRMQGSSGADLVAYNEDSGGELAVRAIRRDYWNGIRRA